MRAYVNSAKLRLIAIAHISASILLSIVIFLSTALPDTFIWPLVVIGAFLFPGVFILSCIFLFSGRWYAEALRPIDRQYRSASLWYKLFSWHDKKEDSLAVVVFRNYKKVCYFSLRSEHS